LDQGFRLYEWLIVETLYPGNAGLLLVFHIAEWEDETS
jgi:hypothetical protein